MREVVPRLQLAAASSGTLGLLALVHPDETAAGKAGKCKSECGECQTCQKGDCKKKNG